MTENSNKNRAGEYEMPELTFNGDITAEGVFDSKISEGDKNKEISHTPITVSLKKPESEQVKKEPLKSGNPSIAEFYLGKRVNSRIFEKRLEPGEYVIYECKCPMGIEDVFRCVMWYIFSVIMIGIGRRRRYVNIFSVENWIGSAIVSIFTAAIGVWLMPESRFNTHYAITNRRVICYNKFKFKSERLENIYGGYWKQRSNGRYEVCFKTPNLKTSDNLGPKFEIKNVDECSSFDIIEALAEKCKGESK